MIMTIGERIKIRREELGMSQEELAKRMGYSSRTTIAKIESGANNLRQTKVKKFSEVLDVTPSWLIGVDYYVDDSLADDDFLRDRTERFKRMVLEYQQMLERENQSEEKEILTAYKNADRLTKDMVKRILGLEK